MSSLAKNSVPPLSSYPFPHIRILVQASPFSLLKQYSKSLFVLSFLVHTLGSVCESKNAIGRSASSLVRVEGQLNPV
jgi:hypothetical protein